MADEDPNLKYTERMVILTAASFAFIFGAALRVMPEGRGTESSELIIAASMVGSMLSLIIAFALSLSAWRKCLKVASSGPERKKNVDTGMASPHKRVWVVNVLLFCAYVFSGLTAILVFVVG